MKKTRKRSVSKDRSFSRLTEPGSAADEVLVLAELRATRDDPAFTVTPLDNLPDDEDAIDRLLVVSGFEKPVTSIVQDEDMTSHTRAEQVTALPDAAADIAQAAAYRVVPLAAMQPPSGAEPELSGLALRVGNHDADGVTETQAFFFTVDKPKPEPGGPISVPDVENQPTVTEPGLWAAGMADLASSLRIEPAFGSVPIEEEDTPPWLEAAAETAAISAPQADDVAGPLGSGDWPTVAEPDLRVAGIADSPPLRIEPAFGPVPIEEEGTPPWLEAAAETVVVIPAPQADDAAQPLASEDWPPHPDPPAVTVRPVAERCEYKTEQARINTVTLILSIVASLSVLVLYFLLMDMKNDVLKLNEMIEIMKEDIQIKRDEPPAE